MTDQPINAAHKPLSRRTMLKTAAWSAPVIAVAIAAPAAAASGGTGALSFTNNTTQRGTDPVSIPAPPWSYPGFKRVYGNTTVGNPSTSVTITSLTLELTLPANLALATTPSSVVITGAGWSVTSVATGSTFNVYKFSYSASIAPYGYSSPFTFSIPTTSSPLVDSATIPPFTVTWKANSPAAASALTVNVSGV